MRLLSLMVGTWQIVSPQGVPSPSSRDRHRELNADENEPAPASSAASSATWVCGMSVSDFLSYASLGVLLPLVCVVLGLAVVAAITWGKR
jgi:hypothetical protein